MTIVADAALVVAALVDESEVGVWAGRRLRRDPVVAPHLLPVEVAHALRRLVADGALAAGRGAAAMRAMADWPVFYVDFAPVASRVWELRDTVTSYDAWYVAVAEAAGVPLVTLDARLARAPGPRCAFEVAPV